MGTTSTELKKEITKDLDLMRTLRDEMRVKLHLASMDAKDEWNKLEPKLLDAERAAEKATQESYDIIADAVKKLNKLLSTIS